jgi:hypothetical protein
VTGCRLDGQEIKIEFLAGARDFSLLHSVQISSEATHLPIQWVVGAYSLGVNCLGLEADHSPPSSAKVKNAWNYTSTPPHTFSWCGA